MNNNDKPNDNGGPFVIRFCDGSYHTGDGHFSTLEHAKVYIYHDWAEDEAKELTQDPEVISYGEALSKERDAIRKRTNCSICGGGTDSFAGDAGMWPTVIGYNVGVAVYAHIKCCATLIRSVRPDLFQDSDEPSYAKGSSGSTI